MSREIDLTKELDAEDIKYLVERCRWRDLRTYAANMGLEEPALPDASSVRGQEVRVGVNAVELPGAYAALVMAGEKKAEEASEITPSQPTVQPPTVLPPQPQGDAGAERAEPVDYRALTVPQLKEIADGRRAEYEKEPRDEEGVQAMTYANDIRKDDLVAILQDDDAAQADDS